MEPPPKAFIFTSPPMLDQYLVDPYAINAIYLRHDKQACPPLQDSCLGRCFTASRAAHQVLKHWCNLESNLLQGAV